MIDICESHHLAHGRNVKSRVFASRMLTTFLTLLFFIAAGLVAVDASEASSKKFTIGAEDMLDIRVWENPQLSVVVQVRPDGMITVPLVGDIVAGGKAPLDLKEDIEKNLASFIQNPSVTVLVQSINSLKVYLLGGGVSSGVLPMNSQTTLMQVLSQIGSLQDANLDGAFLLRDGKRLDVDFYSIALKGNIAEDISLEPGDTIFIPDNFDMRLHVAGAVQKPLTIPFRKGLTVLDAILSAGGLTEYANPDKVLVIRKEGTDFKNIVVDFKDIVKKGKASENIELMPGDMIIAKEGLL